MKGIVLDTEEMEAKIYRVFVNDIYVFFKQFSKHAGGAREESEGNGKQIW